MSAITRGSIIRATWPGVDKWFSEGYQARPNQYSSIFSKRSSSKSYEVTVATSNLGLAEAVGEGKGFAYDDVQQVFSNRYSHVKYVKGLKITQEAYSDNQYNLDVFQPRSMELGFVMAVTKETIAANVLNNGFSSSYTMGSDSDGDALFSASHTAGPYAADFSNLLSAADISEIAVENAAITVGDLRNERGLVVGINPWRLVVPNALRFESGRIMDSELQNDTANNAINVLRSAGTFPGGVVVNNYLTDPDAWFVLTSISEMGTGLVQYERWPLEFGVDNEFATGDACYKAVERYSFGWDNARGVVGNQGA